MQIFTLLNLNPVEALTASGAVQAVVQQGTAGLELVAGKMRLPLPEGAELVPGQRAMVELARTPQGVQARVTPVAVQDAPTSALSNPQTLPTAAVEPEPIAARELFTALTRVLSGEMQVPETGGQARALNLMQALFRDSGGGTALQRVVSLLEQASAAGVKFDFPVQALQLFAPLISGDVAEFERVVRQAAGRAGRSLEGKIARAIASGDFERLTEFIERDVRAVLYRLKEEPRLAAYMKKTGNLREFGEQVDAVTSRLTGEHLQNLRGVDQAYRFFDIPFAPGLGFERVQIHICGEPGAGRWIESKDGARLAFDLSMSRLGDLWIELHVLGRSCSCRILATAESATNLEGCAGELVKALNGAGFDNAAVAVAEWDGNRQRQVTTLLRRYASLDLSV